jgi:uncharacterized phosphosugar-binding protein
MLAESYFNEVEKLIKKARTSQMENIHKAAQAIALRLEKGGVLFGFGTGHSHVLVEEITRRAGGLLQTESIMPYELTMDKTPYKTMFMERLDGLADVIFTTTKLRSQDAIIVISNSGRNTVPVQVAMGAKERGLFVVGLTNLNHSKAVAPRNKEGKKLYEVCDVALDNCGPVGDAVLPVPGKDWAFGPVSTITGAVILGALMCDIMDTMLSHGVEPPVLKSANLDGNDEYNQKAKADLLEKYPDLRELGVFV